MFYNKTCALRLSFKKSFIFFIGIQVFKNVLLLRCFPRSLVCQSFLCAVTLLVTHLARKSKSHYANTEGNPVLKDKLNKHGQIIN